MQPATSIEEQLFLQAIECPCAETRRSFLLEHCGDDPDLLARIERLISLHERNDNVLDRMGKLAPQLGPISALDEDVIAEGSRLGQYKLLQEIGAGGMGVVYMAEQVEPVRRKVAIKVLRMGMFSRNIIARFESERQALALMDHPNITKFFDAGITQNGRPYFVMELITGLPITKFAAKRKLSLRQRTELFCEVCLAIQHAHQKGVIHRDIKPNNILVTEYDGKPVPKVIDFGIAKALEEPLTDKTMFTSYGNMVGTPEYMSPEQAEMNGLDVDTCSDVYSLGVVLYELLTGTTPFADHREKGLLKFCKAICEVEPDLASTRAIQMAETVSETFPDFESNPIRCNQYLKGDLDWILSKCLAKRKEERYETVAALAADFQRHLSGETVLATGRGWVWRIRRYWNRHSWAILVTSGLVTAMLMATVISLSFALKANQAEVQAQKHLKDSLEAKKAAETERDRAISAENTIRELERISRFDSANAKALVRYLNQQEASGLPSNEATVDQKSSTVMKVRVAPNGDLSMSSDDGKFRLDFVDRTSGTRLKTPTRLRIKELGPEAREQVRQVLGFVKEELKIKFGRLDLYVVEPQMMLAELEIEEGDWRRAEILIRQNGRLLRNNFASKDLLNKNRILLALAVLEQNPLSDDGLGMISESYKSILDSNDTNHDLKETLTELGELLDSSTRDSDESNAKVESAVTKLFELKDVVIAEVVAAMEEAFDQRTRTILGTSRKRSSRATPKKN